ncbi:MAG TPA: N-acetylglucosamine-6-phosphate deacetylase [Blastocatellia bacterium]|nr:N-acetylglucosamine-6-phosphate deacetylase [Blastocatellia bacterium]
MNELALTNARLVLDHGLVEGGLVVRDDRIAEVFSGGGKPAGFGNNEIDLAGAILAPGLIDIHIHGTAGVNVQETDEAGLGRLSEYLVSEGVTGYFPTLVPAEETAYRATVRTIDGYLGAHPDRDSARILGIHWEGPFVSKHRCGALHKELFRSYDRDERSIDLFIRTSAAGSNNQQASTGNRPRLVNLMTMAPEVDGGLELIETLREGGLRVFIGHSVAGVETLDRAAAAGARHITHLPNALDPIHHRKPGVVLWALGRDDVTVDSIPDFHHAHPLMLKLIHRAKGSGAMALISDALPPAGLGDGEFEVWGDKILVRDGKATVVRRDSDPSPAHTETLAGSVISVRQACKNMVSLGVPLHEAILMGSQVPARVAGIQRDSGSIAAGKLADLVVFDDDLKVKLVIYYGAVTLDAR